MKILGTFNMSVHSCTLIHSFTHVYVYNSLTDFHETRCCYFSVPSTLIDGCRPYFSLASGEFLYGMYRYLELGHEYHYYNHKTLKLGVRYKSMYGSVNSTNANLCRSAGPVPGPWLSDPCILCALTVIVFRYCT
jgi:hypothetical protein